MTARPETKATQTLRRHSRHVIDRIEPTAGSTPGFPDTVIWVRGIAIPVEIKRAARRRVGYMVTLTPVQRLWWRKAADQNLIAFGAVSMKDDFSEWALLDAGGMHRAGQGFALPIDQPVFPVAEFDWHLSQSLIRRSLFS